MQPATSSGPDGTCLPSPNHKAAGTGLLKWDLLRELDHGYGSPCFNTKKAKIKVGGVWKCTWSILSVAHFKNRGKTEQGQTQQLSRERPRLRRCVAAFSDRLCSTNSMRWPKWKFRYFSQSPLPLVSKNPQFHCSEGSNAWYGPKRAPGSISLVWWLRAPLYATQHSSQAVWCGSRTRRTPSPRGTKLQSRDHFQCSGSSRQAQSAPYLQVICSCRRSSSGLQKTGTKDMQCSQVMTETRSHRKSGLQCRKLRHLWDHPWFPIITLVAWHLAHWALIWPRVWGSAGFIFWPPEGEMEPPTLLVLNHREEMQKLPCQPINTERDPAFHNLSLYLSEGTMPYKKISKELQAAEDHYYKQIPHHIPDPAVEQKNQEIGDKNKRKERTQKLRNIKITSS